MTVAAAPAPDAASTVLGEGLLILALVLALVLVLGVMLLWAARFPFPTSIVVALSLLALVALLGYAAGGDLRPELAAIAGTAIGALASATTTLVERGRPPDTPGDTPDTPGDTP